MKDQRNVDRGKCKVDDCDCQEFELSLNEPSCGYCGDPPAKHENVSLETTTTESASTSQEEEISSERVISNEENHIEPWMNIKLGYIPDPKRKTGIFYNNVLMDIYKTLWPYCGNEKQFRTIFISERTRQYNYKSKIEDLENKINFLQSDNAAAAGKYLVIDYFPSRIDAENLERLIQSFEIQEKKCLDIISELNQDDDALFCANGRLKSGRQSFHEFNEETIHKLKCFKEEIIELKNRIKVLRESCKMCWGQTGKSKVNDKQRKRQNEWKIENRSKKRKINRCMQIYELLGGEVPDIPVEGDEELWKYLSPSLNGMYQITDIDISEVFPGKITEFDQKCLVYMLDNGFFRGSALETVEELLDI